LDFHSNNLFQSRAQHESFPIRTITRVSSVSKIVKIVLKVLFFSSESWKEVKTFHLKDFTDKLEV